MQCLLSGCQNSGGVNNVLLGPHSEAPLTVHFYSPQLSPTLKHQKKRPPLFGPAREDCWSISITSAGAGGGTQPWEAPLGGTPGLSTASGTVAVLSREVRLEASPKPGPAGLLMAEISISVCSGLILTSGSCGQIQDSFVKRCCGRGSPALACHHRLRSLPHFLCCSVLWVCFLAYVQALTRLRVFATSSHPAPLRDGFFFPSFNVQPLLCSHLTRGHLKDV